jgi:hypothetical protein
MLSKEEKIVNTTFNTGDVIGSAFGGEVRGVNIFNQASERLTDKINMSQLIDELSKLRQAMSDQAKETDHYIAMGEVAKAEKAAKDNDLSKVFEYLKYAGEWALDVATQISIPVTIDVIKQAMVINQ